MGLSLTKVPGFGAPRLSSDANLYAAKPRGLSQWVTPALSPSEVLRVTLSFVYDCGSELSCAFALLARAARATIAITFFIGLLAWLC